MKHKNPTKSQNLNITLYISRFDNEGPLLSKEFYNAMD